ncbi:Gfo/Idh/MocA family oxidoreductase [Dinoroseobacter sp. PD6]|uniref:Gfo/Idh/MocA family protein n=1 Tax=Dinoroseobacter sp. PD6 TaxID=3028384 RepID=UPI00237B39EC|nr:Gfo/Idh/MocA family oxidoreductase [Dinoroseobacter sp. PD6]MDD9718152.1 Gfo/Idh/MocA family oxidoreductase [Dinoroseobacter sp. PD6]
MTVRVACLGAGYFAQFHYDAWARVLGAQLVGAADVDLTRATATGLAAFSDLREMLTKTVPDVLDIITPPETHAAAVRTALAHGVRTIICQKPFAKSLETGRALTAEAEAAGATLLIHDNFRFQPWYRAIRAAIDAGTIGEPRQLTFRFRTGDGRGPDAYLARQPYFQTAPRLLVRETAVHWIDTFRYLLGEPSGVYGDLRRENPVIAGEDAGLILFDYPSGARALFDGNRLLDHKTPNGRLTFGEALLEGTDATLSLHGDGSVKLRAFGATEETTLLPARQYKGFAGDCVHALNQHVVAALRDKGSFENRARDYLRVHEIEEAVYASAAEGRRIAL